MRPLQQIAWKSIGRTLDNYAGNPGSSGNLRQPGECNGRNRGYEPSSDFLSASPDTNDFGMKAIVLVIACLAMRSVGVSGAQPGLHWDGSQGDYFGDDDGPFTVGFRFRAETDFVVTGFGAFDYLGDGFGHSHTIGLWDAASGSLIATATVNPGNGASLVGQFRYVDVAGVTLAANREYIVAASEFYGATRDLYVSVPATAFKMAPGLSYLAPRSAAEAPGLVFPELEIGAPLSGMFGANFQVTAVPEPASWALLVVSFGWGWAVWARSRGTLDRKVA